jgi:RNA polymerase sigma factor (sigma-70 family)
MEIKGPAAEIHPMIPNSLDDVLRQLRKLCSDEALQDLGDAELLERFLAKGEETAFAILVQRHGPMVLGVCQRVLEDPHAAEDAFQAAFLVLVRRSASIRKRSSLASWLYGVAQRIARRLRAQQAAQRQRERRFCAMSSSQVLDELTWQELRSVLDEEIRSLPEHYRAPIVLCCLEGKSYYQAARELAWPKSSLASRLSRARGLLRDRLARRGITLSVSALAAGLAERTAVALPALLTLNTVQGAALLISGKSAAGSLSAQALSLGEESMKNMLGLKTKALVLFLAAALVAGGAALANRQTAGEKASPASPPPPARDHTEKPADPAGETFTFAGRVLGPDGKPLAQAKLYICGLTPGVIEYRERGLSGPDGSFRFTVRRDEFGEKGVVPPSRSPPERYVHIGATAEGCGAVSVWGGKAEERSQLTLWLPAEELAHGRIVDLEGKPVAGVQVSASIRSSRAAKDHKPLPYDAPSKAGEYSGNVLPSAESANLGISDKDGRVTLRGLSRDWLYDLYISGPTIVNATAQLAARPQKPAIAPGAGISPPDRPRPQMPLYGSTFTHVAVPAKPILGVVREKGSGKPLAGVQVERSWTRDDDPRAWTTTDKEGRYKLTGLPPAIHVLKVFPAPNMPFLATEIRVQADQPGIEPVAFDIHLERQAAVTGRVIAGKTGKPVQGHVEYRPLANNPNLGSHPLLAEGRWNYRPSPHSTDAQGHFLLPVLRGPGVLLVTAENVYLPAKLEQADRVRGVADKADPELIDCRPFPAWPPEFHAYRLLDIPEGKDVEVEIALTPGLERSLVLQYPDGKPHDTTLLGLKPVAIDHGDQYSPGKCQIVGLAPSEARRLFASTHDQQFAGLFVVKGNETGPVTVKLRPTGTITGRVVDRNGRPIVGVSFQTLFDDGPGRPGTFVHGGSSHRMRTKAEMDRGGRTSGFYRDKLQSLTGSEKTDDQGRFRLTGVLPDVPFDLNVQLLTPANPKGQRFILGLVPVARPTVKPGQTLDLGDLQAIDQRSPEPRRGP